MFRITVFGDETHTNYNRVMLSSVLAGEKSADEIVINSLEWYRRNEIDLRVGVRIVDVDPVRKTVTGDDGSVTPYDSLLLATGSTAWMPPIKGLDKEGVLTFRTLDDTRELIKRSGPDTQAVVIGGGLLGLEAARGLQVQGCQRDRRPPDGNAHGTPARSSGRPIPDGEDEGARHPRGAGQEHGGDSWRSARNWSRVHGRRETRCEPRRRRCRDQAEAWISAARQA